MRGPPGAKKEAGAARSGPDAAAVVRLLLDRGADPRVQNLQGNDALMIAAINGNADVVAELLAPPPAGGAGERKHTGPALTRARNSVGMSAYVLASKAGNAGVATDVLAAARACGGATAAEAEEDAKMIKLVALLDTVAAAHNDALEATLRSAPTPEAGAALAATPFATAETEAARAWRCSPRAASSSRITWTSTTRPAPRSRPTGTCTRRCTAASPTRRRRR